MSKASLLFAGLLLTVAIGPTPGAAAGGWTYTMIYQPPGGGAVDYPSINEHGQVVFDAAYYNGQSAIAQVWSWRPGGKLTLLDSGNESTYPGTDFASATATDSGEVGFSSTTFRTAQNASQTIIVAKGTNLVRIAPNIALGPRGIDIYYVSPSLLYDGSAVFWANGTGHLMRAKAGALQVVDPGYLGCSQAYGSPHGYVAYIGQHGGPIDCETAGSLILTNALTRTSQILVPDNGVYGAIPQNAEANDQGTAVFTG